MFYDHCDDLRPTTQLIPFQIKILIMDKEEARPAGGVVSGL
jgi:hypothetical protein